MNHEPFYYIRINKRVWRGECKNCCQDMEALTSYLMDNEYDDKASFDSVMGMMPVLIWVLIAFSIILGFTVLR